MKCHAPRGATNCYFLSKRFARTGDRLTSAPRKSYWVGRTAQRRSRSVDPVAIDRRCCRTRCQRNQRTAVTVAHVERADVVVKVDRDGAAAGGRGKWDVGSVLGKGKLRDVRHPA